MWSYLFYLFCFYCLWGFQNVRVGSPGIITLHLRYLLGPDFLCMTLSALFSPIGAWWHCHSIPRGTARSLCLQYPDRYDERSVVMPYETSPNRAQQVSSFKAPLPKIFIQKYYDLYMKTSAKYGAVGHGNQSDHILFSQWDIWCLHCLLPLLVCTSF